MSNSPVMFFEQTRPVYNHQISVQQISVAAGEQHDLDRVVGQSVASWTKDVSSGTEVALHSSWCYWYASNWAAKLSKQATEASSLHATAELSTQGKLDACQNLRAISLRYSS